MQFTPDLMPGDVTGSLVYDARTAEFSFREGPVFTNLLLADEINRTPPKTQASLLEAMEERQVSRRRRAAAAARPVHRDRHPEPGGVRGHLPAAGGAAGPVPAEADHADCRRASDEIGDPAAGTRRASTRATSRRRASGRSPAPADLAAGAGSGGGVTVGPEVIGYVVDLCRATRQLAVAALGVSPRGATALLAATRAWAWLSGRDYVDPRRRQGAGPADAAAPARRAAGGRAGGRHRGRRARRRARVRARCRADMAVTGRARAAGAVRRAGGRAAPGRRRPGSWRSAALLCCSVVVDLVLAGGVRPLRFQRSGGHFGAARRAVRGDAGRREPRWPLRSAGSSATRGRRRAGADDRHVLRVPAGERRALVTVASRRGAVTGRRRG